MPKTPESIQKLQAAEAKEAEKSAATESQIKRITDAEQRKEMARQVKVREAAEAEAKAKEAEFNETLTALETEPEKCGFVNRHYSGLTEMTCGRKKGHAGQHQAKYTRRDGESAIAVYGDDAGIPLAPEPVTAEEELPTEIDD